MHAAPTEACERRRGTHCLLVIDCARRSRSDSARRAAPAGRPVAGTGIPGTIGTGASGAGSSGGGALGPLGGLFSGSSLTAIAAGVVAGAIGGGALIAGGA